MKVIGNEAAMQNGTVSRPSSGFLRGSRSENVSGVQTGFTEGGPQTIPQRESVSIAEFIARKKVLGNVSNIRIIV